MASSVSESVLGVPVKGAIRESGIEITNENSKPNERHQPTRSQDFKFSKKIKSSR